MAILESFNIGASYPSANHTGVEIASPEKKSPSVFPDNFLRVAACPACGYQVACSFYDGGHQPLAMIAWPESREEAARLPRLPLDYVRCLACGHIFNAAFRYEDVPYSQKPNLMFNKGAIWKGFLQEIRDQILELLPATPVVIEIGHGDGHFLHGLAAARPGGKYVGFDPCGAKDSHHPAIEFRQALFNPFQQMSELKPDLIVSRHVFEHLTNPLGLLQQIGIASACVEINPALYLEVPCVDRAVQYLRLADFYYEHFSQFTTQSFHRMLFRAGMEVSGLGHGYDGEVVYAFANFLDRSQQMLRSHSTLDTLTLTKKLPGKIGQQLAALHRSGKKVAVWGGVGKSAAFLNVFHMDADRFPIVVDSDPGKAGTFVPGTGQEIKHRNWLQEHPVDAVLIPSQWRAKDIVGEMESSGVECQVLIEHRGKLIDYHLDPHPYRG